ncbi:site-2 protease family protein [Listeria weihenstephanensis]|uniref:Site-2 protease family protein n=1 Tax=Listeria weihenstephanensis TaxID=1006155 RepID=A0A841Z5K3_9LIST|nr:site-2 protease family protein [Listeria weihenstephanensis]MBC1499663.1 site-2 protease family protein [Listeria weihenstephanensis]
MENFLAYPLQDIPYVIVTLLIAFTIHELAHAWVALLFGDDTAKNEGRITFNPLKHVDPVGFIFVIIAGFGWAKPTPVSPYKMKHRKVGSVVVSLVGPVSNLLLAFVGMGLYFLFLQMDVGYSQTILHFFNLFVYLNLVLFIFNLLPLPPLDGYQILSEFLPLKWKLKVQAYENYALLFFLILVITPLSKYTISPIFNTLIPWMTGEMASFYYFFFQI